MCPPTPDRDTRPDPSRFGEGSGRAAKDHALPHDSICAELPLHVAASLLSANRLVGWGANAWDHLISGTLETALTLPEMRVLTARQYARKFHRGAPKGGLFDWERSWFQQTLPDPDGARLFVGGAGRGREIEALLADGYHIEALEPDAEAARECARMLGDDRRVAIATYEDFAEGWLHAGSPWRRQFPAGTYNAVLLGWGSLSHVLDPRQRARVLDVASQLAPTGPILISHWQREEASALPRSRRLGRRLGTWVARVRRGAAGPRRGIRFSSLNGFGAELSRSDLEALGRGLGRTVRRGEPGLFPHATLLPARTS